ncbi:rod shape-determining protein [Paraburkholderia caribensis MBA4]|uniref:Rod shape-determining protein n=1 Tax=Paraburkholderia caribensis MBA4 TaxID=1323664 RepID=A0A0P0RG59_9BURK|nr:rod shape-determining protein [Paraburkholderia caribensis MBA4]
MRLRGAGVCFGLLVRALVSAFCLFAGIRVLLAFFTRCRSVFWPFRWHPRFVSVLHALPFGVLAFSLASAIR